MALCAAVWSLQLKDLEFTLQMCPLFSPGGFKVFIILEPRDDSSVHPNAPTEFMAHVKENNKRGGRKEENRRRVLKVVVGAPMTSGSFCFWGKLSF